MPRPQHRRSQATDRIAFRRAANLRLARTVLLGTVAVIVAIVWLGDQYGIDRAETLQYLLGAGIFVVGLALLGLLGFGLLLGVRKLSARSTINRDREKNDPT